jgi:chromosome segregation ATPase
MEGRIRMTEAELARRDREHGAELARIQAAAEARATALEEARADLRARAERAEHELDQAHAGLGRLRQGTGRDGEEQAPPRPARRRRSGQPPEER